MTLFRRLKDLLGGPRSRALPRDLRRNRPLSRGLLLEHLEDRLAPATYTWNDGVDSLSITLGTGENLSVSQGTGTTVFTLSTGTFSQSGGDVASGDGTSSITFNDADVSSLVTIDNVGAGAGSNDVDFDLGTLTSADVSVLTTAANTTSTISFSGGAVSSSGTVSLQTGNGSISSPVAATTDVTAASLALIATTGIGSSSNPLTTSVANLEAETDTGGIFVSNSGALRIGGASGGLSGVNVTTSGDVQISNDATIAIDLNGEVVAGPSDVTITATGATSDFTASGNNATTTITFGAVESVGGLVSITAGRDVLLGDTVVGFADVAGVGVSLSAGRHVTIDLNSFVVSIGEGDVTVTAGTAGGVGDVSLLQNGTNGSSIFTSGGDITITAAPDGSVVLDSDTTLGLGPATLDTTQSGGNGNVTINADRLMVTINDRISAGTGIVTIQQVSPAWNVDLGSSGNSTASTLELSAGEIDRILAGTLRIGDPSNTGDVTVTTAITSTNTATLHVRTAGAIIDGNSTGNDLTVTNLALTAGQGIDDGSGGDFDLAVTNLAATNSTGFGIVLSNAGAVNVTAVDGVMGLSNNASGQGAQLQTDTGGITVFDTAAASDVFAAGGGNVNLLAADALTVNALAVVKSGSGSVSLVSNFDNAGTGENVTLNTSASVQTTGDVQLNADPNADGNGGALSIASNASITDGSGGTVANLTLVSAADLTLVNFAATTSLTATSTGGSILDDGNDSLFVAAASINLTSAGRIGGANAIDPSEVVGQSGDFTGAIDFDLQGGTLTVIQTGTGGNVQLREVNGGLSLSALNLAGLNLASGDQLALISSGGTFNVGSALTISPVTNADLLLATTNNNPITVGAAISNTGSTATTNLVAVGGTAATITGPAENGIADVVATNLGLFTSGGNVGSGVSALEIDASQLDGFTTGGNAFVLDLATGVTVGQFDAGPGDVTLISNGGPITSASSNDNTAEIIGDVVTLDTTAATSNGNTGQIGSFSGTAQFFEVSANTLNASTNDSRLWISEVGTGGNGGAAIGTVNAGTNTAFLRVRNGGTFSSAAVDGTADLIAAAVNLTAPEGGGFGTAAITPLEINATSFAANVQTAGDVFVSDVAGGLTLDNVSTASGSVFISVPDAGGTEVLSVGLTVSGTDVTLEGGDGITLQGIASVTATNTITLNVGNLTAADADGSSSTLSGTLTGSSASLNGGQGADAVTINLTPATALNVALGAGADTLTFVPGRHLNGGTFDGGSEIDTVDYAGFSTAVSVNLGLGTTGLSAALGGDQLTTPTLTAATGTATLSNYDVNLKTFDLQLTVTNLDPATVTGITLNRAPFGIGGPTIIDLLTLGTLVPAGTGFTLTLTGVDLSTSLLGGAANEAAFLGGITYVNVATAAGSQLRGQVFSTGNVNTGAVGTALATGGISNVENAIGGTGNDSLVGSFSANVLTGNGGDDVLLGAPGADVFVGGNGDDVLIWSNGDGSDVMDGGANADTVQVNGALGGAAINDVFTVNANGTRVDFQRTSTGPFSLDIGTTETLTVVGNAGTETFTVGDLAGVADLVAVNLAGLADADTFAVTPSQVAINVTGGDPTPPTTPGDTLTLDLTGVTTPILTATSDASGFSGVWAFGNRTGVTFNQLEDAAPAALLSGQVFNDLDRDGVKDAGEAGVAGVTVTLDRGADGSVEAMATTDANGNYSFLVEADTTVRLRQVTPTGSTQTTADPADLVTVDGTDVANLDFGSALPAVTVSGQKFADANRNGVKEAGEAGVAGVTITLDLGADGSVDQTTTTDANGDYAFTVPVGLAVRVREVVPAGQVQTTADPADFVTQDGVNVTNLDFGNAPTATTPEPTPTDTVAITTTNGLASTVTLADGSQVVLTPFAGFTGEVTVGRGDVSGDGVPDFIYGAGFGSTNGHVKVFDGATGQEIRSYFAFPGFQGGTNVGSGDVNGDGVDDVIVGAKAGGLGGHVKAFDGVTGQELYSFFSFEGFPGEVRVAGGDVNGDGFADLIVGAGPGGANGHVKVFSGADGSLLRSFFAFPGFVAGGVFVGSGDLDGDGIDEILVGADAGAGPHVKAFGLSDEAILSFFAFTPDFDGGVRVAGLDLDGDGDDEIVVGSGTGTQGHVLTYDSDLTLLDSVFVTDPANTDGVFVG